MSAPAGRSDAVGRLTCCKVAHQLLLGIGRWGAYRDQSSFSAMRRHKWVNTLID